MSTSHISICSDSDDESTGWSVSYIILSDTEDEDTASPAALAAPSPAYVSASPDYVPASDTETEPFEAPTSPDYTQGSDAETKPFEEDP
ncbi:hypothetical protein Tco_0771816 [Tanacetum coccineum]|uniref:Uncharacterized protein n=1 Tax=Tanacetum coccineum TaxID=301880 RepID=A0ABQ4ZH19_9ASTR